MLTIGKSTFWWSANDQSTFWSSANGQSTFWCSENDQLTFWRSAIEQLTFWRVGKWSVDISTVGKWSVDIVTVGKWAVDILTSLRPVAAHRIRPKNGSAIDWFDAGSCQKEFPFSGKQLGIKNWTIKRRQAGEMHLQFKGPFNRIDFGSSILTYQG
jgi:hypothetical protein